MSTVSAIIVNWNGKSLLAECLDSLRMQSRTVDEILVVDNGSIDESQTMIRERYPEVTLIELGENKGFSVANNIGIRRAKGDYIALLNNDLLLDGEWMTHMIDALDADPSVGSCASKMLFYDQRDILDSAGISVLKHGTGINRGHFERDGAPFKRAAKVFGACAGAAVYRAAMFRDIGDFDEDFYIYFEDVDLSFRAQLAGYNCLYVPQAVVYHHYGASSNSFGLGKKYYYLARNGLLVIVKNMPAPLLWRYLPFIVAVPLSKAIYGAVTGQVDLYIRACLDDLRVLPRMLRKRYVIQQAARRSAKDIDALLT